MSDVDDDVMQNITEKYKYNSIADNITRVYDENQENQDITGVRQNDINEENVTESDGVAIQENPEDYQQTGYDEDDENEVSVENESNDDAHILINDLNTVEQINTAQINKDLETGMNCLKQMKDGELP